MKHPLDVDKPGPCFPAGAFAQGTEKAKWDLGHGLPPPLCTLYEVPFSSGAMSGSITQSRGKFPGDRFGQKEASDRAWSRVHVQAVALIWEQPLAATHAIAQASAAGWQQSPLQ